MLVPLSARTFDLCLTAGPGEDISVGNCGLLISPALTRAHLIDSTLWESASKLSGPHQINHWRGFHAGYRNFLAPGTRRPASLCLLTLSPRDEMDFTGSDAECDFHYLGLWAAVKQNLPNSVLFCLLMPKQSVLLFWTGYTEFKC